MFPIRSALAAGMIAALLAGCDRSAAPRAAPSAQPVAASTSGRAADAAVRHPPDSTPSDSTPADVQAIAASYTHLTRVTHKPVYVDPQLAMACAPAAPARLADAQRTHGPHAQTAVVIYMNPSAADAFAGRPTQRYPVGSVIVKEKHAVGAGHDGVGGMIKRAPGYDPAHGNWEYFYFRDPAQIDRGKIASCVQCHSGAARKDYVFGDWAAAANP